MNIHNKAYITEGSILTYTNKRNKQNFILEDNEILSILFCKYL